MVTDTLMSDTYIGYWTTLINLLFQVFVYRHEWLHYVEVLHYVEISLNTSVCVSPEFDVIEEEQRI